MDDIKTNIEKIFAQYTDSISQAVPKRLSFTVNDSIEANLNGPTKKRKLSSSQNSEIHDDKKPKSELRDSNTSLNTSIVEASPWESRRMRADLIEARSLITQLKSEVEHQNKVRSELEILYRSKIDTLKTELDHNVYKVSDMDKHLTAIRKRESQQREELTRVRNEMNSLKQKYEEQIDELEKENHELTEDYHLEKSEMANELSDLNRRLTESVEMIKTLEEERETLNELCEELQLKAYKCDDLERDYEEERQKCSTLESKIKELEYEIAGYGEWKNVSKASQLRLINISELEKENVRLRQEAKNLRDTIGNKLLLEEQVHDLKSRIENSDRNSSEAGTLKAQIITMEIELKNWRSIASDHCPQNAPATPPMLRNHLEEILQKDLVMSNEKSCSKNEKKSLHDQISELKAQNDIYTKSINDHKVILKRHQTVIHKIQKKLSLVADERDCYKRLLDNYEKDLTITGPQNSQAAQLQMRIEMLERALNGYKEMCANLEREIQNYKLTPDISIDVTNTDNYEKLRKELTALKVENEKLKRRKEELEMELENRNLKGDFNVEKYKVLHMEANPAAEAYEANRNEVERLQIEVEKLKRKLRKMEENEQELTMRLNDTNVTINIKEINTLRMQIQSLESKNSQIKEVYKAASQEFREVVYMLFGYRIDRIANKNYRISNVYAESEDEYLNFRINESGVLDMLETEYSISLADMMRTHLGTHNSLPAFLSALTLDLFNRVTVIS